MLNTLESIFKLARERKNNPVEGSYTNKLLNDKSLSKEKVLEEINELIEAVEKNTNKIHEAADVFYHLIMYLEANNVKIENVTEELLDLHLRLNLIELYSLFPYLTICLISLLLLKFLLVIQQFLYPLLLN